MEFAQGEWPRGVVSRGGVLPEGGVSIPVVCSLRNDAGEVSMGSGVPSLSAMLLFCTNDASDASVVCASKSSMTECCASLDHIHVANHDAGVNS